MSLPPPRRPSQSRTRTTRRRPVPQRSAAPVLVSDEQPSVGKILRPLAGMLLLSGALGGGLWYYSQALKDSARMTEGVNSSLRAIAAELWSTGVTAEVEDMDPELMAILTQLRKKVKVFPGIVVSDETESGLLGRRVTHHIMYMAGTRAALTLMVFHDTEHGRVAILGYELGPDFQSLQHDALLKKPANPSPPAPDVLSPASPGSSSVPQQTTLEVPGEPIPGVPPVPDSPETTPPPPVSAPDASAIPSPEPAATPTAPSKPGAGKTP
ncbi:MAG: hypothetical protein EOP86_03540 [Verrucomicrobiaceae bacterium]|nr:MAG: hypothetical protein EOP86_03540 [Verrucomicrobiaceae bacterium]